MRIIALNYLLAFVAGAWVGTLILVWWVYRRLMEMIA